MSEKLTKCTALWTEQIEPCHKCKIADGICHKVFGDGNVSSSIVFVGEAPGAEEDVAGSPFVGAAGKVLNQVIARAGLERSKVFICNACKCFPKSDGKGRNPTNEEIDNCRPFLQQQLEIIGPKVIVALGGVAVASLLNKKKEDVKITKIAGNAAKGKDAWCVFTYHPAYYIHQGSPMNVMKEMVDHVKKAKELADAE